MPEAMPQATKSPEKNGTTAKVDTWADVINVPTASIVDAFWSALPMGWFNILGF